MSSRLGWLYDMYANALAYIEVEDENGDKSIGSAFHIGEGVFVTAKHVVYDKNILEIRITEPIGIRLKEHYNELGVGLSEEVVKEHEKEMETILGHPPLYKKDLGPLEIIEGPYYHSNTQVDVAVFKVSEIHKSVGVILLGLHIDDWIYRFKWHLRDALILGYPPIPMTTKPHLIAAEAQINTYLFPRFSKYAHFILSAIPRGGFSGGLALHEFGFALGVITSSFLEDHKPVETGFMAVLSIQPINELLNDYKLMPQCQIDFKDKFLKKLLGDFSKDNITDFIMEMNKKKYNFD